MADCAVCYTIDPKHDDEEAESGKRRNLGISARKKEET